MLRVPVTFPAEKFNGRMLSAMSTPDLKGTQGSFSLFTLASGVEEVEGGTQYRLEAAPVGLPARSRAGRRHDSVSNRWAEADCSRRIV